MSVINRLQDSFISSHLIWEPDVVGLSKINSAAYMKWLGRISSTHRRLDYYVKNGDSLRGYSDRTSLTYEPLAILIKFYFGDGIHYFYDDDSKNDVYYVIINDGRILPGTDCVVKQTFFDEIVLEVKRSELEFPGLRLSEIPIAWIEEQIHKSNSKIKGLNKKRNLFIAGAVALGCVIFSIFAILINVFIS